MADKEKATTSGLLVPFSDHRGALEGHGVQAPAARAKGRKGEGRRGEGRQEDTKKERGKERRGRRAAKTEQCSALHATNRGRRGRGGGWDRGEGGRATGPGGILDVGLHGRGRVGEGGIRKFERGGGRGRARNHPGGPASAVGVTARSNGCPPSSPRLRPSVRGVNSPKSLGEFLYPGLGTCAAVGPYRSAGDALVAADKGRKARERHRDRKFDHSPSPQDLLRTRPRDVVRVKKPEEVGAWGGRWAETVKALLGVTHRPGASPLLRPSPCLSDKEIIGVGEEGAGRAKGRQMGK